MNFDDKTILITGGTGSFGSNCIKRLLEDYEPSSIRMFSRDELKQSELQRVIPDDDRLRFFIGDIRDRDRLIQATRGVDLIIHAAALKQVPACEYNPFEAVQTNIIGAENVVAAAIDNDVPRTLLAQHRQGGQPGQSLRRDQARRREDRDPGQTPTPPTPVSRFASSAMATSSAAAAASSRSSWPRPRRAADDHRRAHDALLDHARAGGRLRARRAWGDGGRRGVRARRSRVCASPRSPRRSRPAPSASLTGIRPGEKLHEVLVTEDESRHALELDDCYLIYPGVPDLALGALQARRAVARRVPLRQRQQRLSG